MKSFRMEKIDGNEDVTKQALVALFIIAFFVAPMLAYAFVLR